MNFFLLIFLFIFNFFNGNLLKNKRNIKPLVLEKSNFYNKNVLEYLLASIKNKKLIYGNYLNYINLKIELKNLYNEHIDINFYKENIKNLNEEINNNNYKFYKYYEFIKKIVIFKKNLNIFKADEEKLKENYLKVLPEITFQINKIKEKFDSIKKEIEDKIQKNYFNNSDHKNFFNEQYKNFLNEEKNINFKHEYYIEKNICFFYKFPKLLFDINNHNK